MSINFARFKQCFRELLFTLGEGNLMFCCTGSRENFFGSVGRSVGKMIMILNLRVGKSKNKIDHWGKEILRLRKWPHLLMLWFYSFKRTKFLFLSTLLQPKRKKIIWRKLKSKKKNICEISIIILICQKLESVGPIQPKIKLPLPWENWPWDVEKFDFKRISILSFYLDWYHMNVHIQQCCHENR